MATQDGVIKLDGQVGELALYRTRDGYAARKKLGIKGRRILEDPSYERTRENLAEFGRTGKAVKLFRTAFLTEIVKAADGKVTSRLMKSFMGVLRTDPDNVRGQRKISNGDHEVMTGFEFNRKTALSQSFLAPFEALIDRATDSLVVRIPAFAPDALVTRPPGATHFQLTARASEIDFEAETFVSKTAESPSILLTAFQQEEIVLTNTIPENGKPLFLTLGIQYYQHVNGKYYSMKGGGYNALALVAVSSGI